MAQDRYRQAGVDIEKGNEFVARIGPLVRGTHNPSVLTGLGGFSGLVGLDRDECAQPVLVSSTDGVGTKLKLAFMLNQHDTVGIDLVGMVLNDIVVTGARPLFMLDYFSTGKLELGVAEAVVAGIVEGCRQADCPLIGGETAEMPGFYPPGEYDLAGFAVGLVDKGRIIDGSRVAPGDVLVGLASSGLHSNGYSLVRKIVLDELKLPLDRPAGGMDTPLGEALLTPTRVYVAAVMGLKDRVDLKAVAHITGGGIVENLPRCLPPGCRAVLEAGSWPLPPVMAFLQEAAGLDDDEMRRTFNGGLGLILALPAGEAASAINILAGRGYQAYEVGRVEAAGAGEPVVEFA